MGWLEEWRRGWRRDVAENVAMALATLRAHKLRSALTLIGIVIAVTTLISVVAILMGFDRNLKQALQSFGTENAFFFHLPTGIRFGRMTKEERMRKPFTYEDFLAVREACTACTGTALVLFTERGIDRVRYRGEEIVGVEHQGVSEDFFTVYANVQLKQGRAFTAAENLHRAAVVVIGEDIAKGLFGALEPLGREILVNGRSFQVVGVFERGVTLEQGPGSEEDRRVVIPYWTRRKVAPQERFHLITIQAYPGRLAQAIDQTRVALRRTRRVAYDQLDNFSFSTAESVIRQFHDLVGMVALVTAVLSSVGLMIGGVGVMNIMLVSVTERTREIGVRKAIGARRRDILWQFLTEAMALTGAGGLVGVLVGFFISTGVGRALPNLPTFVPWWAVVLGVGVAASVGLFFGIYPALKAAQLDPVDALRYE